MSAFPQKDANAKSENTATSLTPLNKSSLIPQEMSVPLISMFMYCERKYYRVVYCITRRERKSILYFH